MIALILEDASFEQDIRELCMAFFPGEKFVYKEDPGAFFSFQVRKEGERFFCRGNMDREGEHREEAFESPWFSERILTKNSLKRNLYHMLADFTKKQLPWGALTGIRPTKIPMEMLERGLTRDVIQKEMQTKYLCGEEKADLAIAVAQREYTILKEMDYQQGYSLYIGIPFCPSRCLYCSFTSYPIVLWKKRVEEYIQALSMELKAVAELFRDRRLMTIYMGGGTPTSLEAWELREIFHCVREYFNLSHLREFTVEAGRADSITREKLMALKEAGVGRISVNPQTMQQRTLDYIGRNHSVEDVERAFYTAREIGFDNINMDFILGLKGETLEDVADSFEKVKAFEPEDVTLHSLALKRAARLNTEHLHEAVEDEIMVKMFSIACNSCRDMGLSPYYLYRQKNIAGNLENIGFSKEGKEGIYNILIMEEKHTIAACGAGASSKIIHPMEKRIERIENVKDPGLYVERIQEIIARKKRELCH